ncbi:MAG: penicillin-binding protein activator [Alteraurantiacibacter sp.]
MHPDRRLLLKSLPSVLLASSLFPLGSALAAQPRFPAALLVPQTGDHAALGRSMERAASLAQGADEEKHLLVFDTTDTTSGAHEAARQARREGATIILGPVFSAQTRPVLDAVGSDIPVLSFSNDLDLRESGGFMLGVTADQAVRAILGYAAGRGIRRVAVGGAETGWAGQVRDAARANGLSTGISITPLPSGELSEIPPIVESQDGYPDAVLMPDAVALARLAPSLSAIGVQPLGAFSDLDLTDSVLRTLDGAWVAAPDIADFSDFASAFESRMGTRPGLLSGLAYDAARIAGILRLSGSTDRSALLSIPRFDGVCGDLRFREDGSAMRTMSVLQVSRGRLLAIGVGAPV